MIVDEEVYLEHYGVKGMQWGVRKQQAVKVSKAVGRGAAATGRVAWKGTKAVGRGVKKTAQWSIEHPKAAAYIASGAAVAVVILRRKHKVRVRQIQLRNEQFEASKQLLKRSHSIRVNDAAQMVDRYKRGSVIRNLAIENQHKVLDRNSAELARFLKEARK